LILQRKFVGGEKSLPQIVLFTGPRPRERENERNASQWQSSGWANKGMAQGLRQQALI